ncbi:hypothetical protein FRB94_013433 [Tulasnella sp. JGI-2019a]|nr:hypothetical protein FRB93_010345 [Tulasnella sp. JGI-2019a]KAG8990379.1 hypothetical protein FRB94_013433 [Tulasnella sp. JGI-2019a]KAG9027668.1 hypothetical protein FRB95_007531 [Tulasnella sp. JGI-2019a]
MNFLILSVLATLLIATRAQEAWDSPCPLYCFPGNQQSAGELQAVGYCPPLQSIAAASGPFYTNTCSCYNYQTLDGAMFTNCYICSSIAPGASFQDACVPNQTPPVASAACQSQSDAISQACDVKSDIGTAVSFLCDAEEGLSAPAKGVFGALKFLATGVAREALSIVDAGCRIYTAATGSGAGQVIEAGCNIWTNIGRCTS